MRQRRLSIALLAASLLGLSLLGPRGADGEVTSTGPDAASLYNRFCLACHGTFGDGKGPAAPWLWPRPRDFTRGDYKWRTTPSGSPPTEADLTLTIRAGAPGTSMHAFGDSLSEAEILALARLLPRFAPDLFAEPAVSMGPSDAIAVTPALVARGEEVYASLGCVACHGDSGRGDGLAAANLRDADGAPAAPYDLTTVPLRRPRPPDQDAIAAILLSLRTGLSGTSMPAYADAAPAADLAAVAAYIDSIRHRPTAAPTGAVTALHPTAIAIDRAQKLANAGYWPGRGTADEEAIFGGTIAAQGPPPAGLTPAQSSLDAARCARCHAKQHREWQSTWHGGAASPGLIAQVARLSSGVSVESCLRCHAPLAEQQPKWRPGQRGGDDTARGDKAYIENPLFDPELRAQGITCAACHVREWRRLGPPPAPGRTLLPLPGYPITSESIYERADFCLGCHQLPPRLAVNGRPLLDTYREWLDGPYMRRGVQCQHCHMPNREHTWKGIHDPDTFRQGIAVEAIAGRSASGAVSVRARVTNVGAGHYLPTTPTPAAWLSVELVDGAGAPVRGAYTEKRIGRHLAFDAKGFRELEDTRIPPGEHLEVAAGWRGGGVPGAVHARVRVRVAPDDYYEGLYEKRLAGELTAPVRALFNEALRRARAARYQAYERLVPIR